ncbi:hypothetical protein ATG_15180 [Desulfurococcaceae archaeon AG1]|nr:hypothetical protein ATG_15180 [Desulfurococcaceae archaeon AG1]
MLGAVGRGHPERVEASDKGSNERGPEAYEAKGRAVGIKISTAMKSEPLARQPRLSYSPLLALVSKYCQN